MNQAKPKMRILVVDDHAIVRQGMMMLINQEHDLCACCEAANIENALLANHACQHDLAIIDMSLGEESGLMLIRQLRQQFPELPILMLSMHDELIYAEPALKAGANGYLMKQAATELLLQAIRVVLKGELYVSERLREKLAANKSGHINTPTAISRLSSTEVEILYFIGDGKSSQEIADLLSRSIKTIESHKANIKRKLNLDNARQLSKFAITFTTSGTLD